MKKMYGTLNKRKFTRGGGGGGGGGRQRVLPGCRAGRIDGTVKDYSERGEGLLADVLHVGCMHETLKDYSVRE